MKKTQTLKPNLLKGKQKVMEDLAKGKDIVIIRAGKEVLY